MAASTSRKRQRRWATSGAKAAAVACILPTVYAQAGLPDVADCPAPPKSGGTCTKIETYEELRRLISGSNGPKRVNLCPFTVEISGEGPIRIRRRVTVACQKQNDDDECIIQGPGGQIEINGRRARVILQGITFVGVGNTSADSPAVNVKKASTRRPNLVCQCEFSNHGNSAIVASSRSVLYVVSSSFLNGGSTAVFLGRKSFVSIFESTFVDNTASKPGTAIRAAASAELYIEGSSFSNTSRERSPSIALGGRPRRFRDGGRNELGVNSVGGSICTGAYLYLANTCIPFIGDEPKLLLSTSVDRPSTVFSDGEDVSISVGFSNSKARSEDLIIVALTGSVEDQKYIYPQEDEIILVKQELCGTSTCRQPTNNGWIELKNLDLRAGEYKVHLISKLFSGPDLPYSLIASTDSFVIEPSPFRAFRPGPTTKRDGTTGLRVAENINVRVIAETGRRVRYTSPEATEYESSLAFHSEPDGAAIFPLSDRGFVYMSNAELGDRRGGVFAVEFDQNGEVKRYEQRLRGTSYNCSGGSTSYGTYVSCEEWSGGMCWQVDPTGRRNPEVTNLVEPGNHEAMAQDNRDPRRPCFFVTEDHPYGALRRWCPDPRNVKLDSTNSQWNMLHGTGARTYLEIYDGSNQFGWTNDIDRGRRSANKYFPGSEGITFDGKGKLYVVSKTRRLLYSFDLDRMTYKSESTARGLFNGGSFEAEPDQISQFETGDRYQYLTEDGGSSAGLFAREKATGNMYTLFYTNDSRFDTDEITGVALSPDGRFLYACVQERGYFLELSRSDGERFEGRTSNLKFHARHDNGGGMEEDNIFHSARQHG